MWVERKKDGKLLAKERYIDPLTGKTKRVAISIDRDTKACRKTAQSLLEAKIESLLSVQDDANITLKELSEKYIERQMKSTRSQTWRRDKSVIGVVVQLLGEDTLANKVTARYVDETFRSTGKENVTLNSYLEQFKRMYKWAYRNDFVNDISFLIKLQKYPDNKKERIEDKFLSSDDLSKLLSRMKVTKWRLLTHFLALSGLRIGEALALLNEDVTDVIRVNKTYDVHEGNVTDSAKTDAGNREVFIQPELADVVSDIRAYIREESFAKGYRTNIFIPDEDGDYVRYFAYNKYLKENTLAVLGRKLTPHALRHTHVSLLAEQGYPLDAISRRVGHEDSKITKAIYLHVTEKQKEKDRQMMTQIRLLK